MRRFNLSHWAVTHQALVMFFIIALTAVGFYSYNKLGRAEDPSFTIKVAVITVAWPGATAQEILDVPTDLPGRLALTDLVSPLRLRGMAGMLARIKRQTALKAGL